ncbi:MAG TPA: hypothetical protein VLX29_09345 [Nitrospirota bacterium]|nr:hypothetical protein [Nitrospirota bacterium]
MINKYKFLLLITMLVVMITGCGGQVSSSSTASTTGSTTSTPGGTGDGTLYTGSAILSWSTPTLYSNGTPLLASDIAGYVVYWGTSSGTYPNNYSVSAPTTNVSISNLKVPIGPFFAAVRTLDNAGNESALSSQVSAILN